jgi:hypothetical protein
MTPALEHLAMPSKTDSGPWFHGDGCEATSVAILVTFLAGRADKILSAAVRVATAFRYHKLQLR